MASVEVLNGSLASGVGGSIGAAQKERAKRNVPPAELPVVLDDDAVKPGHEEDGNDEGPAGAHTHDGSGNLGVSQVDGVTATLPEEQHGQEAGSDAKVDRHREEGLVDGVASEHDTILGDEEDDSTKSTRKPGGNNPGEEDLYNARVDRVDSRAGTDPLNPYSSCVSVCYCERGEELRSTYHSHPQRPRPCQ